MPIAVDLKKFTVLFIIIFGTLSFLVESRGHGSRSKVSVKYVCASVAVCDR